MHITAMKNGELFFRQYSDFFSGDTKVVDIGSQNVNGSLSEVAPKNFEYIGIDFIEANGVDIVLEDPYKYPLEDNSVDIVVSSSCFEHSELFWVSFLEVMRILKPSGLFYLNVPSSGNYHRYPVDCWRFFPDSGRALVTWAKRNNINAALLESYVMKHGAWRDNVSVFLKEESFVNNYSKRILEIPTMTSNISNGFVYGSDAIINYDDSIV